jgi:isocitrate lyase
VLAERAGFELLFLSGFAVAGTRLGEPDFGLLTQTEMLETARRLVGAVQVPVIVDGDTGHGGPLNVQRLVRELVAIGAGGVLLEDQVWPKRCGHMRGKEVIPAEQHVQKIRAAVDARAGAKLMLIGRTDARAPLGLDEAIRRGRMPRGGRRRDLRRGAAVTRRGWRGSAAKFRRSWRTWSRRRQAHPAAEELRSATSTSSTATGSSRRRALGARSGAREGTPATPKRG